jgi:hypothetical protein
VCTTESLGKATVNFEVIINSDNFIKFIPNTVDHFQRGRLLVYMPPEFYPGWQIIFY